MRRSNGGGGGGTFRIRTVTRTLITLLRGIRLRGVEYVFLW